MKAADDYKEMQQVVYKAEVEQIVQGFGVHVYRGAYKRVEGNPVPVMVPIPSYMEDGNYVYYNFRLNRNGISVEDALFWSNINYKTIHDLVEFLLGRWAVLRFMNRQQPNPPPERQAGKDIILARHTDVDDIVALLLDWERLHMQTSGDSDGLFKEIINLLRHLEIKPTEDVVVVTSKSNPE